MANNLIQQMKKQYFHIKSDSSEENKHIRILYAHVFAVFPMYRCTSAHIRSRMHTSCGKAVQICLNSDESIKKVDLG